MPSARSFSRKGHPHCRTRDVSVVCGDASSRVSSSRLPGDKIVSRCVLTAALFGLNGALLSFNIGSLGPAGLVQRRIPSSLTIAARADDRTAPDDESSAALVAFPQANFRADDALFGSVASSNAVASGGAAAGFWLEQPLAHPSGRPPRPPPSFLVASSTKPPRASLLPFVASRQEVAFAEPNPALHAKDDEILPKLERDILRALSAPKTTDVHFVTPAWLLPLGTMTEEVPYREHYRVVDDRFGEYKEHHNVIYISACDASFLHDQEAPFGTGRHESVAFRRQTCSKQKAEANMVAKHLVVYVNFHESGYFGHLVDNVLPRLAALLPGAMRAGHNVSAVFPPAATGYFSASTHVLLQALNVSVLYEVPATPHRAVGLSSVASWDRLLRRSMRQQLRATLLAGVVPANCGEKSRGGSGLFVGRTRGASLRRRVEGAEHLAATFQRRGFAVVPDASQLPVLKLATRLYAGVCVLAGFAGTALLNLIFLPDGAVVVEFNTHKLYADYWQWAHALGLEFRHFAPTPQLDEAKAEELTRQALLLDAHRSSS
eukprot:TRINITY_DN49675_c0_g1_i1.p1 TRINITY_DN49675_c0_g1~~TRINITY_DN49675_c0_g1_i1.p1  ORF type:complete len:558 (+),score=91.66 TRINITY_DN49675_c0_g1_i1:34-1674(+)